MSKEAMKLALEALENSVDLVREDAYQAEKLYGNYPTRQGKVAGLKVLADDHEKAITALREALVEPPTKAGELRAMKRDFWEGYVPEPDKRQQALDKKAENARELGLDYEPATYTFKTTSEPMIAAFDMKPNYNMTFHNGGKQVGVLDFNGPEMVFNGDMNESAKVFFDFIASAFKARLEQERADEREACAKLAEKLTWADNMGVASAIRARSNT